MKANGELEYKDGELTFLYDYKIDHDEGVMYHADGTGTPPYTEVEIVLKDIYGLCTFSEFEFKFPKGDTSNLTERKHLADFVSWELDYIYYGGECLYDMLSEHCLQEEGI